MSREEIIGVGVVFLMLVGLYARFGTAISSDGRYYFAYLPSLVIDHDLDFTNNYEAVGNIYDLKPGDSGRPKNPFQIGSAVFWLPFYLVGHLLALIFAKGSAGTGMTVYHQHAVAVGTIFYGTGTLFLIYRSVKEWVSKQTALLGAMGICFGSFVVFYIVAEPSFAHGISSFIVALLIYLSVRLQKSENRRHFLILGVILGLAGSVRSQDLLFGLVPVLLFAQHWKSLTPRPTSKDLLRRTLLFIVGTFLGYLPHLLAVRSIYGFFTLVPQGEGFMRWGSPELGNVLFSTRHGLIAETPIMFFAVIGVFILAKRNRRLGLPLLIALACQWYVNASVTDWWAGSAFGMRRFTGATLVLGVGLGTFLDALILWIERNSKTIARTAATLFVLLFMWINIEWIRLYRAGKIPGSSTWKPQDALINVVSERAQSIYRLTGNPFSFPANWLFATRYRVSPARYDTLAGIYFGYDHPYPGNLLPLGDPKYSNFLGEGFLYSDYGIERTPKIIDKGSARIFVPLYEKRSLEIRLNAATCFAGTGATPEMEIVWNGKSMGIQNLSPIRSEYTFSIPSDGVRIGINELVIRTNGRPDLPARMELFQGFPKAQTEGVTTDLRLIPKNGNPPVNLSLTGKGFHIVEIDRETGTIQGRPARFDTSTEPWAEFSMLEHVKNIPDGTLVLGVVNDDAAVNFGLRARQALQLIGCSSDLRTLRNHAYAFIGKKGGEPRTAFETLSRSGRVEMLIGPEDPIPLSLDWILFEWKRPPETK